MPMETEIPFPLPGGHELVVGHEIDQMLKGVA